MTFETYYREQGIVIVEAALSDEDLVMMERAFPPDGTRHGAGHRSGHRQNDIPADVMDWLETHPVLIEMASRMLAAPAQLVRALTFDKTEAANWFVPWHQDREIAVAERKRVAGFRNWTPKDGYWQVEPPVWLLEQMVTLRIHIDRCRAEDGPLEVVPSSHEYGRLKRAEIASFAADFEHRTCLAERGDIVAMSPLIIHRSCRAKAPTQRRTLHLEFCSATITPPLEWAPLSPQLELAMDQIG